MSTVELREFGWRHAGRARPAVTRIDLRLDPGERVLLLGASGSGKSTLLSAMAGLLAADSGEQSGAVLIDGAPARQRRDRVGMLFQDPATQLVMARAGDDVAFGLENRGCDATEIWPRVDKALSTVGFPYGQEHPTTALSGGEQQRLALAGLLALSPSLMLLDEPTANLDPAGAQAVHEGLSRALTPGDTTMVLVEHRVAPWLDLIDRVIALTPDGGILADDSPEAVFDTHRETLRACGVWLPDDPPAPRHRRHPSGPTALHAEALAVRYADTTEPALSDVSLDSRQGQLTAVTGPNGSGKSTLALALGGLIAPTSGTVRFAAAPQRLPHRMRARTLAGHVGSVFQNPEQQFVTSRVRDELALGPRASGQHETAIERHVAELLERLRLTPLAEANPFTLSGGEARRLSVATALSRAPKILILDEPTFGQDLLTWSQLADLVADLRDDGHAIIAVTHDADFTAAVADHTVQLQGGRTC